MNASNVGAGDVRAPILFGEEHIVVDAESIRLGATARAESFSETAQDLRAAHGAQERQLLLRAVLRSIGFDWLCYYRLTRIGESITRVLYFRAYSPPNWPKRYVDERYFEVDPRLAFALRYEWPLVWDLADLGATLTAPADADRLHRLLQDAERAPACAAASASVS
ncbi:autoinducer binding domain-containing protein [Cupriavidus basilensis]